MAAVTTLYDENGMLDLQNIQTYVEYLVQIGVQGVYILGTTGEWFTLTLEEKIRLVEAWHQALCHADKQKRLLAIVNVSAMSILDIISLANLVEKLDRFDGLALLQPVVFRVDNENKMVSYIEDILEKTQKNLPLLYYHFPEFTEPKFKLESFISLALKKLPQFCAIKFTDYNFGLLENIHNNFHDNVKIFVGYDEILLPAKTTLNIDCAICATFNFRSCVGNYFSILCLVEENQLAEAREKQRALNDTCLQLRSNGNFFASLKEKLSKELYPKMVYIGSPRSPMFIKDTFDIK